ncbi:RecX family transcriptional regulator, partial [Bacillus sp. MHSD17]|nr:RecX family transcriptional regulator [Bacillus sp. MHSD17]
SGLRKTNVRSNSLAHRTTWLRSDFKGYSRDVIQICLEELKDEKDDEKQQEALHYHGNKYYEKYKKHDGWTFENKMKQALYRKGFSIDEIEVFLQMKREEG